MARLFCQLIKVLAFVAMFASPFASLGAQAMMKGASPAPLPGNQLSLSGIIGAIVGNTLFLTTADGQSRPFNVGKDTFIQERKRATLASIQPGDALGVAATEAADGRLTATAINIFAPELWQRARKGQFPMADGQVMTNAQVERLGTTVEDSTLYLKYDMLVAAISVPATAEIHRSYVVKLSDLKIGMTVSVRGVLGADGIIVASNVSFDEAVR